MIAATRNNNNKVEIWDTKKSNKALHIVKQVTIDNKGQKNQYNELLNKNLSPKKMAVGTNYFDGVPFPTAMSVLGAPGNDHLMKMLSRLDRVTSYRFLEEFENSI